MISKSAALFLSLLALPVHGQQQATYSDTEAGKHVGEEAIVTGKVFTVTTSGKGNTFLNFGARFPNHTFGAVVFAKKAAAVGDLKQYEGKEVLLTGRIELGPDQKPQIVISDPDQIRLADAAKPPPPATPPPTTAKSTPAASKPAPSTPRPPEPAPSPSSSPSPSSAGKIELSMTWNSGRRGGELARKDLARLFGDAGTPSESIEVDTSLAIYPGVNFLTPVSIARKALNLEGVQSKKVKVGTPGLPQDSFSAHVFEGVFPGGFTRLHLVTDGTDQVISVLLVDTSSRTRVTNETDTTGYHTYNFVSGDWKAAKYLVVKHEIVPKSAATGVVVVDSMLIDPVDPETASGRPSKSSSYTKQRTGKVLERSRWYVPAPIVNLILRCVGG